MQRNSIINSIRHNRQRPQGQRHLNASRGLPLLRHPRLYPLKRNRNRRIVNSTEVLPQSRT